MSLRIAIFDDNKNIRESISLLLATVPQFEMVGSFCHVLDCIDDIRDSRPDIVLMDIDLPDISGIEGVRTIRNNFEKVQIMMFTVFEDEDKIFAAIRAGASGYLLKKATSPEITDAVKDLYEGGAPMSSSIARKVIQAFQSPPSSSLADYQLTAREKEILFSLVDGLSYKKIGEKYFISLSTIRTHISNIYSKLHVHSKSQAVAKVLQNQKPGH